MTRSISTETLKKELFEHIRKEDWDQVVKLHESDPRAFKTRIASYSGDTALLQAIFEGRESVVERLVGLIPWDAKTILGFSNNKLRTSLHAAAATGSTKMCKIITEVDESLVFARDYKGETPLFRAVQYGRMEAFLYLHTLAYDPNDHSFARLKYCWNDDDETILHNAISRENFDLAFQIIHMYKELVNLVDRDGDSPLHALARKPAAFESGSGLRGRDRIIYDCLFVEYLKIKELENSDPEKGLKEKSIPVPQQNKQTFLNFVRSTLGNAILGSNHVKKKSENVDIESRHHLDQNGSNTFQEGRSCLAEQVSRAIPVILGYGDTKLKKIKDVKEKHIWASQVLDELLHYVTLCDGKKSLTASEQLKEEMESEKNLEEDSEEEFEGDSKITKQPTGSITISETAGKEQSSEKESNKETAILVAANYGVAEMIEKILIHFPMAIYDKDQENKNIVLVALKKRHLKVLKFLLNKYKDQDHIAFQKVDYNGNTALHYATMYDVKGVKPWPVPGAAMQMQWEIKWYEYMEKKMPPGLYLRTNKEGQTPKEMFSDNHEGLLKSGGEWLTSTATSCSVVAALIAGVAFASSTATPGGTVRRNFTYELFAISSLVSLCFSVTSLVMFLAILTSRQQEKDFSKGLPRKILFGLSSLFVSIASVLVTFCAGHFLVFKDNFKYVVVPVYAVTLLPLCLFVVVQFPLYFDLLMATFWNPFN